MKMGGVEYVPSGRYVCLACRREFRVRHEKCPRCGDTFGCRPVYVQKRKTREARKVTR